jgi:hypothetical protein
MAKTYNFGEKKTEYNAKLGKEVEVWQSPKYLEAKKKAIEALESDMYKGVLTEGDFWILMNGTKSGKMAYTGLIISHNGCLKINDALPADKRFKPSCMSLDKDGYNGSLIYSYSNDDQGVYEVGEVSSKNCTNAYPYAMALKRCMDRVILKNSRLAYAGIYSDSEAEEFKNEPKEESKAPANVSKTTTKTEATSEVSGEEIQKNLVKLCKDNNLDLRQICKEYKLNVNSTVEDLAAAYYALNNKILKGEV